jgi:hypothetical protein
MCLMYVTDLASTIWTIMRVCCKAKSYVRVILPNFCSIQFDPNDEVSMFLPQIGSRLQRLRRATN